MPEMPEIETVKCGLVKHILKQRIQSVAIYSPKLRYPIDLKAKQLVGQTILAVNRRGKYLLFELTQLKFLCHLGMSGCLHLTEATTPRQKHDHVDIQLEDFCLRYHDPRRFGALLMVDDFQQHPLLSHLGPEPLSKNFTANYLYKILNKRKASIKQAIMNAKIVVGIGNIYANEALFRAKIHPLSLCNSLNQQQIQSLVAAIKSTLKTAIKAGGTTLKDFTDINAKPGYFSQQLFVYGRQQQACRQCNALVESLQQQNRSSFYCPQCQKI